LAVNGYPGVLGPPRNQTQTARTRSLMFGRFADIVGEWVGQVTSEAFSRSKRLARLARDSGQRGSMRVSEYADRVT